MTGRNVPETLRAAGSGPSYPPLSAEDLTTSGLLHVLNETVLWPLGLALTVTVDETPEGRAWSGATLTIQDLDEVVITGHEVQPHADLHTAFDAWRAERLGRIKP